ncbi:MAG: hypothetical protein ABEJ36_05620 [Candidatus Nanosalina sp.]
MSIVEGPKVEEHQGVVEIQYNSDGVLAVPEGTEYSRGEGEFEVADSNQLISLEEGSEVYLETDAEFAAYDLVEFAKALSGASGDTEVWGPEKTKVWDPGTTANDSGDTKVFDPSDYDIGDLEEYTKMMKENADTIILELADRDVTGGEASETLEQLFDSMNDTFDRFVHGDSTSGSGNEDTRLYEGKSARTADEAGKRKLSEEEAEEHLSKAEKELEESEDERTVEDYADAGELLEPEQTEIFDFESEDSKPEEGQSEISDW